VSPAVEVYPLVPERWGDLTTLFGPSGAGHCWCAWWRQTGSDFSRGIEGQGAGNCDLLRSLTDAGAVPGLIGYRDGRPVAWVSVAPRPEYGRVLRSPSLGPGRRNPEAADPSVWSIVCFWMPARERGKGLATALLQAAVDHARAGGAQVLEGYPVDTAGERQPTPNLFTGTLSMFRNAGFTEVERRTEGRPIVRLALAQTGTDTGTEADTNTG